MNAWENPSNPVALKLAAILLLSLTLYACGGGNGLGGGNQVPDAVIQDLPIAYVKRTLPIDAAGNLVAQDLRDPIAFNAGAELLLRDLASPTALETVLTNTLFAAGESYDVKDLDTSYDGNRLIFALRAPLIEGLDADQQPTWNIWQYEVDTKQLNRIIVSDLIAEQGQDFAPTYLPDGRIVFSSTRQRSNKSTLLDEGKPQFSGLEESRRVEAAVLHIMDSDGNNIRQISFNQSHDLDPTIMADGKILFSRWDNMGSRNSFNLYRINPDGSDLEFFYGNHSHSTGSNGNLIQFSQPREMPNGQLLSLTRPVLSTKLSGDLTQIDVLNFTENGQPIITGAGSSDVAQLSLSPTDVSNDESVISVGGYYSSAFPLWDGSNRLLVSWSLCRLTELDADNNPTIVACTPERLAAPNATEAKPLFGIWMYNLDQQTLLPIITGDEGFIYTEAVALQPRSSANYIVDTVPEQSLVDQNVGIIHIRSVYDFDGIDVSTNGIDVLSDPMQSNADQRPARFLRLVKAVSMPDDNLVMLDASAFGRSSGQLMREILGYVPIEPDGSVKFKAPAKVAFAISILDKQGRRISGRHQNWLQLAPGEQLECNGCHTGNSSLPHGRKDAQPASINSGATTNGLAFPNTNPALFADAGETMAETYSRINGVRSPTVDIRFEDDWTDETLRAKDNSVAYAYQDLKTPVPTAQNCLTNWTANCRITPNYVDVIQPIWQLSRITLDIDGITILSDNTCTRCHSPMDEMGNAQLPVAQLDLSASTSTDNPDQLTSYRELLFADNEQEFVNGAFLDRLIPRLDANGDPVFEVDIDGNLILDPQGNPIPVLVTIAISPPLNVAGAIASPRLFDIFDQTGSHSGWLSTVELKLIAEWLDIGGQYYNNPFDVPQN